MITCRVCNETKEKAKGVSGRLCAECQSNYQRAYRQRNSEKLKEYYAKRHIQKRENRDWVISERKRGREYWQDLRHEAIMAYGGYRCACCGETGSKFLSLDYINNDGAQHRRQLGYDGNGKGGSSRTLKWLKDNGYPSGFQVLCMNCNHAKARNAGICPHQSKPREFGESPERIIPSQITEINGLLGFGV